MFRVDIITDDRDSHRDFDTFARATEYAHEVMKVGFRGVDEEHDCYLIYPASAIRCIKIKEIVNERKAEEPKERQRSEVAKGKQRKHRGS